MVPLKFLRLERCSLAGDRPKLISLLLSLFVLKVYNYAHLFNIIGVKIQFFLV